MKLKYLISSIASFLLLIQCKSKEEGESALVTNFKFTGVQPDLTVSDVVMHFTASSVYGRWIYPSTNIYFSAELEINRNGTFKYVAENCFGKTFSEGTWLYDGLNHVLESQDKFKKQATLLSDTTYHYFDKAKFRFKDGFLYEVTENGILSDQAYFQPIK